jgi:ribonuclease G
LPLPWFRRKKRREEQAPQPEAAAPEQQSAVTSPPAERGPEPERDTEQKPRKRRRGSRGGRGRKKPTSAAKTDTKPEADRPAEEKPKEPQRSRAPRTQRKPATRRRTPPRRAPLPAAKRELLVAVDVGEQRVAMLEDERVAEVYLERPERRSIAGNIYLGTVDNVLPGMEAAFVDIGLEKNGFLYVDEIVVPELEGRPHGRKIQELIKRGEQVLVQAVKDPMKSKGARLTTEISLPGRFVVFVPFGEGLGVSRRLEEEERTRLRDVVKALDVKKGGVIVRTAAEGASAEDVERDLVFLQRLWKTIEARAKAASPPELIYQEAELPLRVVRDLFTTDFERAHVDDERTFKRIVGYLKKTSPHMVERVERYKDKTPLFEAFGADAEIASTLSRRVDLPSGGYLVFDYAEAFTVIDVNTGRFVGSRSKGSGARLEDTVTKNNLEAVKEVVRQLRLRDIGGIIVIDFIDMANPNNRATVEEALRKELERDRTKTYVVEISPLGLVEMTRQNVTDGPREILTKKCPTCGGDGIVVSEATAAVELERRLRALATGSRSKAFRVEVAATTGTMLIGPGAARLAALEAQTKKRFFLELKEDEHNDHFVVLEEGSLQKLTRPVPVDEGSEVSLKLVEVGLHDSSAAIGRHDGLAVSVADAAALVGKKVKVRVERVLDGTAFATLLGAPEKAAAITAESEAEKPTRRPPARKKAARADEGTEEGTVPEGLFPEVEAEPAEEEAEPTQAEPTQAAPKKRTRRGTRGGRRRKKTPAPAAPANGDEPTAVAAPKIHVPARELGEETELPVEEPAESVSAEASADGDAPAAPRKKKTRRGSRGGRRRRKSPAAATAGAAEAPADKTE